MEEALEEGEGQHRGVKPMVIMMILMDKRKGERVKVKDFIQQPDDVSQLLVCHE